MTADQPLSGQQISELNKRANEALQAAVDNMHLRRAAMQFAAEFKPTAAEAVSLAAEIYGFLSAPVTGVKITVE